MVCVDRHHHVVEDCQLDESPRQTLRKGGIQADAHAVLVALGVERLRRMHSATVEVNAKVEAGSLGRKLSHERTFMGFVQLAVQVHESILDLAGTSRRVHRSAPSRRRLIADLPDDGQPPPRAAVAPQSRLELAPRRVT